MKANELRIGNLVYPYDDITLVDGKKIKRDCVSVKYGDFEDTEHLYPIPLTEKWLKIFGYFIVETNECVEAFKENFRYSIQQVEGTVNWFWCDGETVLTSIKYVHQLQNLYFALTGTELTLNK